MAKETKFNSAVKYVIDHLEDCLDDNVRQLAYDAINVNNLKPRYAIGTNNELVKKAMKSPKVRDSLEILVSLIVAHVQGNLDYLDYVDD